MNLIKCICMLWLMAVYQLAWSAAPGQVGLAAAQKADDSASLELTAPEQDWLRSHPVVRVGSMRDRAPLGFEKDGVPSGFSLDYMRLLAEKVGIELQFVPGNRSELQHKIVTKEIDVLPRVVKGEAHSQHLLLTPSYGASPLAIFANTEDQHLNSLAALRGKKVAIVEGLYSYQYLSKHHPEIDLMPVASTTDGLVALSIGEVDAMIERLAVGNYFIASNFITNVMPLGTTGNAVLDNASWQIGVRRDLPELFGILQKGMSRISQGEFSALVKRFRVYSAAIERASLKLNENEQAWLDKHRQIRLAYDGYYPPYSHVGSDGNYQGYAVDVIDQLAKITGIEFNIDLRNTWKELYTAAQRKEVDVVATMVEKEQRRQWFNFTQPYIFKSTYLFAAEDSTILSPENLDGKRLAMVSGYVQNQTLIQNHPEIGVIEVDTVQEALRLIEQGHADAYVGALSICNYIIQEQGIQGVVPVAPYAFDQYNESFGVRKDWPELVSILNKALQLIPEQQMNQLRKKWGLVEYKAIEFSAGEKAWLEANPVLRVSNETDWPPYDFNEMGQPKGYTIDYLGLLAEKLGIELEFVTAPWHDLLQKVRQGDIDLIHPIIYSEERSDWLSFTQPIITQSSVMVLRKGEGSESTLESLRGKTLAGVESWLMTQHVQREHPEIKLHLVDNINQGLNAVRFAKADAWIDAYGSARYLIDSNFMSDLVIAGEVSDAKELRLAKYRIAVRKGRGLLHSLLNKAIASMTPDELRQLNNKWRIYSDQNRVLHLTLKERQWLEDHPIVRTAIDRDWAPIEFVDENNEFKGVTADYIKRLEGQLGVRFEVAKALNWQQSLAAFKRGELDLFSSVRPTAERKKFMDFTDSYAAFPSSYSPVARCPISAAWTSLKVDRSGWLKGTPRMICWSRTIPISTYG